MSKSLYQAYIASHIALAHSELIDHFINNSTFMIRKDLKNKFYQTW